MAKSDSGISTLLHNFLVDPDFQSIVKHGQTANIFDIAKINEMRHSSMLAWLLNPRESHGLGEFFIKALIRTISTTPDRGNSFFQTWTPLQIELGGWNGTIVEKEFRTTSGNIDILLFNPLQKSLIVIENKYGASEGPNQRQRYADFFNQNFSDYKKVYVYLDIKYDDEPKTNGEWIHINYDWIAIAIEEAFSQHSFHPDIMAFMNHYLAHITDDRDYLDFYSDYDDELFTTLSAEHKELLTILNSEISGIPLAEVENLTPEKQHLWAIYKMYEGVFNLLFQYGENDTILKGLKDRSLEIDDNCIDYKDHWLALTTPGFLKIYEDIDEDAYWPLYIQINNIKATNEEFEQKNNCVTIKIVAHWRQDYPDNLKESIIDFAQKNSKTRRKISMEKKRTTVLKEDYEFGSKDFYNRLIELYRDINKLC